MIPSFIIGRSGATGGAVDSFAGRDGSVVPSAGDYTADKINDAGDGSKVIMTGVERSKLTVSRDGMLASGWESASTATTIAFNYSTRTMTLQTVAAGTYYYWANGTRLSGSADKTVVLPAVTALYYVSLDDTGTLIADTVNFVNTPTRCPVAAIYYLSTAAVSCVIDQKVPVTIPSATASYMVNQAGPWIVPGDLAATFGSTDGSFSIATGTFVLNSVEYAVSSAITSATRVRHSASGAWTLQSVSADVRPNNGTNLAYDNGTGLTACTVNYYSVCAIFITYIAKTSGGSGGPTLHVVMGQAQYATQQEAEAVRIDNFVLPVWLEKYGRLISMPVYQRTAGTPAGVYVSQIDSRQTRTVDGDSVGGVGTITISGGGSGGTVSVDSIDFEGTYLGTPSASATIGFHAVAADCTLQTNLVGSVAVCNTAPSGTTIFSINHNGSPIGSITFSASETAGVFSGSVTALELGDSLAVVAPAALNGLSTLSWNIQGTLD